jgi:hypothetical protein
MGSFANWPPKENWVTEKEVWMTDKEPTPYIAYDVSKSKGSYDRGDPAKDAGRKIKKMKKKK